MRPLRLELRGFTSFRDTAVVDFEDRRLFAITGPTGAGKSSLLDAMTWALYGEAPRVGRATRQLITHGARAMAVRFDFGVRGERYRIARQFTVSGPGGTAERSVSGSRHVPGTTRTSLERLRGDGGWELLEDRVREATARVTALLGLDFTAFTKTVLLPQGAFDEFLRGDEPQRREILSRLLGLERYLKAREKAHRVADGARQGAHMRLADIERLGAPTPEEIAGLEREHASLDARAKALEGRTALLTALADDAHAVVEADGAAAHALAARAEAAREAETARKTLARSEQARDLARSERDRFDGERAALGYNEAEHRRLEREADRLGEREAAARALANAEVEQRAAIEATDAAVADAERLRAEAGEAEVVREQAEASREAARDALAAAASASLATERALGEAASAAEDERAAAERAAAERDDESRRLSDLDARLHQRKQVLDAARTAQVEANVALEAAERAAVVAAED